MLSPATFIGIAKAIAPAAQTAAVRPASTAQSHGASPVAPPQIQRARVLTTPPIGPLTPPPTAAKPPATTSATPQTTPPRNLPRGSLLDLSV